LSSEQKADTAAMVFVLTGVTTPQIHVEGGACFSDPGEDLSL
jgi:hypothetical protein